MMVLGLDVNSVRTGYAFGPSVMGSLPTTGAWELPGGADIASCCAVLFGHVEELCRRIKAAIVAIEEPITLKDRSAHTDLVLKSLFGAAAGAAAKCGAEVVHVAPSTWRLHFTGKGVFRKKDAKPAVMRVVKLLKWPADNHDEADAAGIWDWACHYHARTLFNVKQSGAA